MTIVFAKKKISKKSINSLYQSGCRVKTEHLTCIWKSIKQDSQNSNQLLITIPKKKIKKAVNRNYIKRIIRESYRANLHIINHPTGCSLQIMIIYNKSTMLNFHELNAEFVNLFNLIKDKLYEGY